mgnify:CR=1 FL=1
MRNIIFLVLAGCFCQVDVGYDASRPMTLYAGRALEIEPVIKEASAKLSSQNAQSREIVGCMLCDNNIVVISLVADLDAPVFIRPDHVGQCARLRVDTKVTSDEIVSALQGYVRE